MKRSKFLEPSPSSLAAETLSELQLKFAAVRLLEAGQAASTLLEPCAVKVTTAESASLINLFVDDRKVATFGPGHPLECADALYGFIAHLATRTTAEA